MMKYKVSDIINSNIAISQKRANIAYDFVSEKIRSKCKVDISFEGIEDCSSLFINYFIGKLYLDFGYNVVKDYLEISDIASEITSNKLENAIKFGTNANHLTNHSSSLDAILS